MQPQQPSIFENLVDERIETTQPFHPAVFDQYLADGWRVLSNSIICHSLAYCRNTVVRTIPLRIRLDGFEFSKSQRRLLRRNADLKVQKLPIQITPEKETLFTRHTERFRERKPNNIDIFIANHSSYRPVKGMEFDVYDHDNLVACSFFHLGEEAMSGTYCFFDPFYERRSLGSYTMLLELEHAIQSGLKYYYHGYCYDVPSQFDYKLSFNNLEFLDWRTRLWLPKEKVPVYRWETAVANEKPA